MVVDRVTAWASWAEWRLVYQQLKSESADDRHTAVRHIQAWRVRGRLPVAIDVTGSFVEVMLHDATCNATTKSPRSEHELRLMYAMAMVRLVNGIVDVAQKGSFRGSISNLAQELQWPQWFVDLRHSATHGKLPSLPALRIASKEALWLLCQRYWEPQLTRLERRESKREVTGSTLRGCRSLQLIDKQLRLIVRAASRAKATDDQDQRLEVAVRDLTTLGIDESRLLNRLVATVLAKEPTDHRVLAVHLLCGSSSDNFALRLVRLIASCALELPDTSPQPAPDNAPSLRNTCDAGDAGPDGARDTVLEPSHALEWWKMLLPPKPTIEGTVFARAAADLAPHLQTAVIRRAADGPTVVATKRLGLLWPSLTDSTAAKHLQPLFGPDPTTLSQQSTTQKCKVDGKRGSTELDDMLAFVAERKRRRRDQPVVASRDPWTSVGTVFDPASLQVRCQSQLPQADAAFDAHILAKGLASLGHATKEGPESQTEDVERGEGSTEHNVPATPPSGETLGLDEDKVTIDPEEYRKRADVIFADLTPFGS